MATERRLQIVTGGTSGMGLATAKRLGEFGPVLIGGRSEARLSRALEEMKAAGVEAYGKTCDVSDVESVSAFRDYALTIAPVGSVVNAAGVDFDNADAKQIVSINMNGVILVTDAFLPCMKDAVMVHYSSITGYYYQPTEQDIAVWNEPAAPDFCEKALQAIRKPEKIIPQLGEYYQYYCASKRFVIYYTMANALRFGKNNNRIFSVAPGSFDTPMLATQAAFLDSIKRGTAFQRVGDPEEMADLFIALMRPGHDYLTGCDIIMDGGKYAMSTVKQLQ